MGACDFRSAYDSIVYAVLDGLDGHADRISDSFDAGATVGNHADAIDS